MVFCELPDYATYSSDTYKSMLLNFNENRMLLYCVPWGSGAQYS